MGAAAGMERIGEASFCIISHHRMEIEVARETGAKIVLSSDWRSLAQTNEVLKQVLKDRPEWVGRRG